MKRTTILILAALLAFSAIGCEKKGNKGNTAQNDSSSSDEASDETVTSTVSEKTTKSKKSTATKIYITTPKKTSVTTTDSSELATEDSDSSENENNSENDYDTQDSQGYNGEGGGNSNGGSSAAESLYQSAVSMYSDVLRGCPYSLDYDDTNSNGFAAISDSSVTEVDDIASLYCTVFTEPDGYIYERYSESGGKVYCNDASRGNNIYYTGTDLEYVSGDDSYMTYNAISHYSDPNTGEITDKTSSFSIVWTDNGYKVGEFTYPK